MVYNQIKSLEAAGAIAAELEVVPDRVASEITKRTNLLVMSMGSGPGGDVQYLFAEDILGYTNGHLPRHSKVYRDFKSKYDELQLDRVAAFKEYINDIRDGSFPQARNTVPIADSEYESFISRLPTNEAKIPGPGPF